MKAKKPDNLQNRRIDKYRSQIDALILQLKPIVDYWVRLSRRDQQILMVAGGVIGLMFLVLIITSALQFKNTMEQDYTSLAIQKIDSQIIANQYKNLSLITPNDFSSANSDRIKADVAAIIDVKDAEILLDDNNLNIKAKNVKFEKITQFLDQLRKSYGLFPNRLIITRSSQSGYADFQVGFSDVEQQ